jgi:hypothetical protein
MLRALDPRAAVGHVIKGFGTLTFATSSSLHFDTHEKRQNLDALGSSSKMLNGFDSICTTSPGRTGLINFARSIDAMKPPAFLPNRQFSQARQDWAALSTRITPGTIGSPGKWPSKNASSPT